LEILFYIFTIKKNYKQFSALPKVYPKGALPWVMPCCGSKVFPKLGLPLSSTSGWGGSYFRNTPLQSSFLGRSVFQLAILSLLQVEKQTLENQSEKNKVLC
jgi:hypothetical protein